MTSRRLTVHCRRPPPFCRHRRPWRWEAWQPRVAVQTLQAASCGKPFECCQRKFCTRCGQPTVARQSSLQCMPKPEKAVLARTELQSARVLQRRFRTLTKALGQASSSLNADIKTFATSTHVSGLDLLLTLRLRSRRSRLTKAWTGFPNVLAKMSRLWPWDTWFMVRDRPVASRNAICGAGWLVIWNDWQMADGWKRRAFERVFRAMP